MPPKKTKKTGKATGQRIVATEAPLIQKYFHHLNDSLKPGPNQGGAHVGETTQNVRLYLNLSP